MPPSANACTVTTTGSSTRIDITLSAAKAAALEALNTANLRLLLQAGAFTDVAYNASPAVNAAANKTITYEAATLITIDGRMDPAEWTAQRRYVSDPNDSQWTSANEIDALYVMWDATYLYLAIDGQVSGDSQDSAGPIRAVFARFSGCSAPRTRPCGAPRSLVSSRCDSTRSCHTCCRPRRRPPARQRS